MPQVIGFTVDTVIGAEEADLPAVISGFISEIGGRDFLRANIAICSLAVIICALLSGFFNYLSRINIARGTERFTKNLRDNLFFHIQNLPFSWLGENLTGDTIQRCTYDVEVARNFISKQLLEVIRTVILIAVALIIVFSMNVFMASLITVFIPLVLSYTLVFYRKIGVQFLKADEDEGELMVAVQENLSGVRVVRAFGREKHELEQFNKKNEKLARSWIDLGNTLGAFWGLGDIVSGLQLVVVIIAGAFMSARGNITLGEYIVFISYTLTIAWPVRQLGRTLSEMSKAGVSLGRIKEIFDSPEEKEPRGALTPPLDGDIRFENVSFSYGPQRVLKNLNFEVKKGETLGILGMTGSGKSTITYLLNRLYDLEDGCGSITINGVDIRSINRRHLRKNVGLVLQEPFLFSKTILENINIASPDKGLDNAREMARVAAVDDNIMSFSKKYDTVVGERGMTLSGGQRQRIAIARTLALRAPIMIFDDSTSNLDTETDAAIREAIRENTKDATVIMISHRISTLMDADKIIVLEDGEITQSGTHGDLIARDGTYRRVYELQLG